MIHVISSMNRHLYEDAIETHFHVRHDIFVGERRWKALARADGRYEVQRLVARGFVRVAMAILVISVLFDLVA